MIKKTIQTSDTLRVLLTDTLPYETPLPFSNYFFHSTISKHASGLPDELKPLLLYFGSGKLDHTIPLNYSVPISFTKSRDLSVPHPVAQVRFCHFYEENKELILESCRKSNYSIRFPVRVAKSYYEKEGLNKEAKEAFPESSIEIEPKPFSEDPQVASSYFAYKKYNLQYKFFESFELINLEEKYALLETADIHRCFYNIYTHTLSWSVKNKEFAKLNIKASSFDNSFDELIRFANYNETNGILVGPEFSRVFAEILLQQVDLDLELALERASLKHNVDYAIRRYVDDFFIFSNSPDVLDRVQNTLEGILKEIKLYLNESKKVRFRRPFITGLSIAKRHAVYAIDRFMEALRLSIEKDKHINITKTKSLLLDDLRSLAFQNSAEMENFAKFSLVLFSRKSLNIIDHVHHAETLSDKDRFLAFLLQALLDIAFYLYAMERSVRSGFVLCRFLLEIRQHISESSCLLKAETNRLIFIKLTRQIRNLKKSTHPSSIDTLNLLLVLKVVGQVQHLPPEDLLDIFGLRFSESSEQVTADPHITFDYFQICTLIYYIRDHKTYSHIKIAIEKYMFDLITDHRKRGLALSSSSILMLALDLLACPWISCKCKKQIARELVFASIPEIKNESKIGERVKNLLTFCSERYWFFDWSSDVRLLELLKMKELKSPY